MGLDRIRTHGLKNIVRNNYLGYTDVAIYTGYSPFPFHTDGFQAANSTKTLQKLVFENNYDTDNADTVTQSNSHHFLIQNDDGSALEHVIVRGNIVIRPGGVAYDIRDVDKFRLYNNTYIQIYNGSTGNFRNAFYFSLSGTRNSDDHRYTNNTFSNCPKLLDSHGIITDVTRPTNFSSGANHAYNYTGSQGTLPTGASPANLSSTNPQFTNLATDDLTLQSTSPLRNAGAASTLANGSGSSSTTLVVDDSLPFCDGFGIADGDFIQIGNTTPVRIAAIDYTTHTLTLASARTWADNDAVYVYGTKDVGALPYGTSPPAGTVARANNDYTANVSGDVRMVVFVEDGIPSNPVYDAPYSYTSSGGNVEAYAYPRYATAQEPTLLSSGTVRIGFRLTQV
jgi:hypothetical protein